MMKLNDSMYVQEEGSLVVHSFGPSELCPWCVVDSGSGIATTGEFRPSKLLAMFASLEDALAFAETKAGPDTIVPGREWSLVND